VASLLLAAPQHFHFARSQEDLEISRWIAQLDGLSETAEWDAFIGREALFSLIARGVDAAPQLSAAALESPSWSIRASSLFALAANGLQHGDYTATWTWREDIVSQLRGEPQNPSRAPGRKMRWKASLLFRKTVIPLSEQ
jgi:hypothetical protein